MNFRVNFPSKDFQINLDETDDPPSNVQINRRLATLLKKRLWCKSFPVNFVKFLRTPFLQNTSVRLLLFIHFFATSFVEIIKTR